MSLSIHGFGWVTPLGHDPETVWQRLMAGERAPVKESGPVVEGRAPFHMAAPTEVDDALARTPRIRRSSAITYFSVAAGLAALRQAGCPMGPNGTLPPEEAARTAVIFAVCSGGVNYTRRFYEKIVAEGPASASPLLFPETVYNAPASHLSAVLGIDGMSYTLVGDASVGLAALGFADEILATDPTVERCVVVGAEECDWILWQGYASWRLLSAEPCIRLHADPPRGTLLAEGAAAFVVGRGEAGDGRLKVRTASASYFRRSRAAATLEQLLSGLPSADARLVIGSANGTWVDHVEAGVLSRVLPGASACYPKASLGEGLGASALTQAAVAAMALERNEAPGLANPVAGAFEKAAVTVIGLNQQTAAAVLSRE